MIIEFELPDDNQLCEFEPITAQEFDKFPKQTNTHTAALLAAISRTIFMRDSRILNQDVERKFWIKTPATASVHIFK